MEGQEGKHEVEIKSTLNQASERLEQLFLQAETVKMICLRRFMEFQNGREKNSEADGTRLAQFIFKAIEIQLRLLGEQNRQTRASHAFPGVEEVWEALLHSPELGPLLRRDSVRANLLEYLKEKWLHQSEPIDNHELDTPEE